MSSVDSWHSSILNWLCRRHGLARLPGQCARCPRQKRSQRLRAGQQGGAHMTLAISRSAADEVSNTGQILNQITAVRAPVKAVSPASARRRPATMR